MDTSWSLMKLVHGIHEGNYDRTFSAYRLWIKLGTARGGVSSGQLYNDILGSLTAGHGWITTLQLDYDNPKIHYNNVNQRVPRGQLIHGGARLLPRFITDAELDPALSTYAIGLHDRLCRESLDRFFRQNLDCIPGGWGEPTSEQSCEFYTWVNLVAHWVNLGYVELEDIRDHILQSLAFQPTVHPHQLNSLLILLKISGATFAAYIDPSVMDRCCDLLKPSNLSGKLVPFELAEVRAPILTVKMNYERCELQEVLLLRERGWEGLPTPPILRGAQSEITALKSQDPAATPVATSLGLPGVVEQPRTPTPPSPTLHHPPCESPKSSTPPSPSTSTTALSDFTIADSLDDEPALEPEPVLEPEFALEPEAITPHEPTPEPEAITPHDMFYLDDGSVEVVCSKTLFRVHTSTLSFHSPVLRQMFSPPNLAAAESPNGCPRVASSDTPTDFATLLKAVYIPG